jgi:hypothetical protein
MAMTMNIKGTSVPAFHIGKKGVTIHQGPTDPNENDNVTINEGDIWIDTHAKAIHICPKIPVADEGGPGIWNTITCPADPANDDDSGRITRWHEVVTDMTANSGDRILYDTVEGDFTISLPANPKKGDSIEFIDGTAEEVVSGTVRLYGNGNQISKGYDQEKFYDLPNTSAIINAIWRGNHWNIKMLK